MGSVTAHEGQAAPARPWRETKHGASPISARSGRAYGPSLSVSGITLSRKMTSLQRPQLRGQPPSWGDYRFKSGFASRRGVPEPSPLHHRSTRRFDAVLVSHGLTGRVVELPESTRTAAEAARAVGCELRQIVKSLVFQGGVSGKPILVLASGANRVDESWMARYVGEPLTRAHPEFARSVSGFAIGGVPPAGHTSPIPTYIDCDLLELREVWAAAGHPHAVCRLTSRELLDLTHGQPVPVTPLEQRESDSTTWITFDCYGTLVDWREGFAETMRQMGLSPSAGGEDRLFRAYLAAERVVEAGPYRPYREVMAEALVQAARAEGLELSLSQAEQLPRSLPEWPLFPDVRDSLAHLRRQGFHLGILSNIDRDLLDRTLSHHGISVDFIVTAEDVRSYKPAPPHWARFLKGTGAVPSSVFHVSGSYGYDLEIAAALGFRTVYVARYGPPPAGPRVDLVIPGLRELSEAGPLASRSLRSAARSDES